MANRTKNSLPWGLLSLLGMLLIACEGDGNPSALETPPVITRNPNAAELRIVILVEDGFAAASTMHFSGILAAGRHAVVDSALTIGDRRGLPGPGFPEPGVLQYSGFHDVEWTASEIVIVPPRVSGVTPPEPSVLRVPTVVKVGPDTIRVPTGERPTLHLGVDPNMSLGSGAWRIVIAPPSGSGVLIYGQGFPPSRIPLPDGAIEGGFSEPLTATLDYNLAITSPEQIGGVLPDGVYGVSIGMTIRLQWILIPTTPL